MRKGTRDIPPRTIQDVSKSKKGHIETRGTPKEAVTEGNPTFTNLIEASVYDTTPVHYISMVSEELK